DLSEGARARPDRELQVELPDAVVLYRIQGPLFFAAADKALRALSQFEEQIRYLIIDMRAVPSMDMSALVPFEQALGDIRRRGVQVYLSGVKPRIRLTLKRAGRAQTGRGAGPLSEHPHARGVAHGGERSGPVRAGIGRQPPARCAGVAERRQAPRAAQAEAGGYARPSRGERFYRLAGAGS